MATGAAIAAPGRRVICLVGDRNGLQVGDIGELTTAALVDANLVVILNEQLTRL